MQMNIKDDEVRELAERLSRLTGESLTATVKTALKEKLQRETGSAAAQQRFQRIMELGRHYREAAGPMPSLKEIEDEMYDENGLPR